VADVPNRKDLEAKLAKVIGKISEAGRKRLMAALGDPPALSNVPKSFWNQYGQDLRAAIEPILVDIAMAQMREMADETGAQVSWGLMNARAAAWASGYTFDLVSGLNAHTMEALRSKVEDFFTEGLTLGELADLIAVDFGAGRAELIAITEVTRAAAEGESELVAQLAESGITMSKTWHTKEDERVCPVCGDLDETEADENGQWETPDGDLIDNPPAHPRCRCFITHMLVAPDATKGYNPDQPRDEAGRFGSGGGGGRAGRGVLPKELAGQIVGEGRKAIEAACRELVDGGHIHIPDGTRLVVAQQDYKGASPAGKRFNVAAACEGDGSKITVYPVMGGSTMEELHGIITHEVVHAQVAGAREVYRKQANALVMNRNYDKLVDKNDVPNAEGARRYPAYAALRQMFDPSDKELAQMKKDDGVTPYSKSYWKSGPSMYTPLAIEETLAEHAMLEARGDHRGAKGGATWGKLRNAVALYSGDKKSARMAKAKKSAEGVVVYYLNAEHEIVDEAEATMAMVWDLDAETVTVHIPEPDAIKGFNPDQPRDEKGRFGSTGVESHAAEKLVKAKFQGTLKGPEATDQLIEAQKGLNNKINQPQRKLIEDYVGSGYTMVNKNLRETGTNKEGSWHEKISLALDAAFDEPEARTHADVVVRRGMNSFEGIEKAGQGQMFMDLGYNSTSTEKAFSGAVKVELFVPKGTPAIFMPGLFKSGNGWGEKELLLPRGSTYRIDSNTKEGNVRHVKATWIGTHQLYAKSLGGASALKAEDPDAKFTWQEGDIVFGPRPTDEEIAAFVPEWKWNPDQPRDERGRFGSGGGGVMVHDVETSDVMFAAGTAGFSGSASQRQKMFDDKSSRNWTPAERLEKAKAFAMKEAGLPEDTGLAVTSKMEFVKVQGQLLPVAGKYDPVGNVVTLTPVAFDSVGRMRSVVAHEAQHAMNALARENMASDPALAAQHAEFMAKNGDKLAKEDGVTEYSKAYWATESHTVDGVHQSLDQQKVHDETLAEVAAVRANGYGQILAPVWKDYRELMVGIAKASVDKSPKPPDTPDQHSNPADNEPEWKPPKDALTQDDHSPVHPASYDHKAPPDPSMAHAMDYDKPEYYHNNNNDAVAFVQAASAKDIRDLFHKGVDARQQLADQGKAFVQDPNAPLPTSSETFHMEKRYETKRYRAINDLCRYGKTDPNDPYYQANHLSHEGLKETIDNLDSYVAKTATKDTITMNRGMSSIPGRPHTEKLIEDIINQPVGFSFRDDAFTSTSHKDSTSSHFAYRPGAKNVFTQILVGKGARGIYSTASNEAELLLDRGGTFVKAGTFKQGGKTIVRLIHVQAPKGTKTPIPSKPKP